MAKRASGSGNVGHLKIKFQRSDHDDTQVELARQCLVSRDLGSIQKVGGTYIQRHPHK